MCSFLAAVCEIFQQLRGTSSTEEGLNHQGRGGAGVVQPFKSKRALDMSTGGDSQETKVLSSAALVRRSESRHLSLSLSFALSLTPCDHLSPLRQSIPQHLGHDGELPLRAAPRCTYCNTGEVTGQGSSGGIKVSVSFVDTEFSSITAGKSGGKKGGRGGQKAACAAAAWVSVRGFEHMHGA